MKVTIDTNVPVRAVVRDDPVQAPVAAKVLMDAALIAVTLPCLCELVWVLLKVYAVLAVEAAHAIRELMAMFKVEMDRPAAEAGLIALEAGGDFADGVIAHEGRLLGGEMFVSFDKRAVALLVAQGHLAGRL